MTQPPDIVEPEKKRGKKENKKEGGKKNERDRVPLLYKGLPDGVEDGDESVRRKRRGREGAKPSERGN